VLIWYAGALEPPFFIAFSSWLYHWDTWVRGLDCKTGTRAISWLALVDPAALITRAGSLCLLESKKINSVLVAATFALDVNGVWRKGCHAWVDVFSVCDR